MDNISWLTNSVIAGESSEEEKSDPHDISSLTKMSESVGAFVDVPVKGVKYQLQRVISRCECEFRYISLDNELDPLAEEFVPSTPQVSESRCVSISRKLQLLKHMYIY